LLCTTGTTSQSSERQFGLIIVGNSGVGKSFLANILLQEERFEHKLKPTAVTTSTDYKSVTLEGGTEMSIFNIPGLIENNQAAIERNKREIDQAFVTRPVSIILFVLGNIGGRMADQDIVAFQALDQAYGLQRHSLCFMVNDLPANFKTDNPNYEAETTLVLEELLKISPIRVGFGRRLAAGDATGKADLRNTLVRLITQCRPAHHEKRQEITLRSLNSRE
jgi:predicted GTPase